MRVFFFRSSDDRLHKDVKELRDFSFNLLTLFLKLIFDIQCSEDVVKSDVSVLFSSECINKSFFICLQLIESV